MGKLDVSYEPNADDIGRWLEEESDFGFELEVGRKIEAETTAHDLLLKHGGSYVDPVTKKTRERDFYASIPCELQYIYQVIAAIECKNVRKHNPVVVLRMPRDATETGLFAIWTEDEPTCFPRYYKTGDPVGKHVIQLAKAEHDGSMIRDSREIFEKWSQALSSLDSLVQEEYRTRRERYYSKQRKACLFLPVVVLPDNRLWVVDFDSQGNYTPAQQVEHCSYYVHQQYRNKKGETIFAASHIEFLTISGIPKLVHWLEHPEDFGSPLQEHVSQMRSSRRQRSG